MQIHSYDTPIIMNEAHLHRGFCDYHLCTWGEASANVAGFRWCVPMDFVWTAKESVEGAGVSSATSLKGPLQ